MGTVIMARPKIKMHAELVRFTADYSISVNGQQLYANLPKLAAKRFLYEETGLRAARRRAMVKSWKAWDNAQRDLS